MYTENNQLNDTINKKIPPTAKKKKNQLTWRKFGFTETQEIYVQRQ